MQALSLKNKLGILLLSLLFYTLTSEEMSMTSITMVTQLKDKQGEAFDREFIKHMIPHHQSALDMAQLALTHAKRPEIKKLAKNILSTQQKEINLMEEWQKSYYPKSFE
ncbi:DUF305 domain-containing protein [Candidatus Dependentiae bacterium]|nr:DUF305 domain-containing protein [Candidatus Dependentiae bacterium]